MIFAWATVSLLLCQAVNQPRTNRLNHLTRGVARRPRPLKVKAAEMTGNIDDFADEINTGNDFRLHRRRRQFIGVDSAERDLRGPIAFGFAMADGDCYDPSLVDHARTLVAACLGRELGHK